MYVNTQLDGGVYTYSAGIKRNRGFVLSGRNPCFQSGIGLLHDFNNGATVPLVVVFIIRSFFSYIFDFHPVCTDSVFFLKDAGNSFGSFRLTLIGPNLSA